MKLYVTVYDRTRQVWEMKPEKIKVLKNHKRLIYGGYIYDINSIYRTEAAAWGYWNNNYKARKAGEMTAAEVIQAVKDAGGCIIGEVV